MLGRLMKPRCVSCGKPYRDARLCDSCGRKLERIIAGIPALAEETGLADELNTAISRQTAMGSNNGGSRSTESAVAFNTDASHAAQALRVTLVHWMCKLEPNLERQARVNLTEPTVEDIARIGRWLLFNLDLICQHDEAAAISDEITYAVSDCWRAVDRPANRSRILIGACLDVSCDGELYATFPTVDYDPLDERTHAKITCDDCAIFYSSEQWISVGRRLTNAKLSA